MFKKKIGTFVNFLNTEDIDKIIALYKVRIISKEEARKALTIR